MNRLILVCTLLTAAVVLPSPKAEALAITPATVATATGNQTSQSQINAFIAGLLGGHCGRTLQAKPANCRKKPSAGSYTTQFFNSPSQPEDATITYDGGDFVGPTSFLLVKDGNHSPAWYLFNLTNLGWNGKETLAIQDFWVGPGAISHVTLYGTRTTPTSVPEPATFSLLAVGLLGAGVLRRRRS